MDRRSQKNSFASASRLTRKSGALGFPTSDYSEFGVKGILIEETDLLKCNDNAKRSLIVKLFDFKGFIER